MAIYPIFPGGKRKAFTLSFDDAWPQDRPLIELMNKYGIKGTFNINSGEKKFTDIADPKELYKGHEVAVHGLTHAYLDRVAPQTATYEIIKDRENLEKVFGKTVRGFAYPYGAYNEGTVPMLKNCGIKYGRVSPCTEKFTMPSDWLLWHPTCHILNPQINELCDKFLSLTDSWSFNQCFMFYIYGHSYELDQNNAIGWKNLEDVFKKIADRDDIWFATNIEICDYITSFQNLIMSVDGKYIYNPTNTTFSLAYSDGDFIKSCVTLEIKPGEEVVLP